jgi:hypothetical protein
MVEAGNNLKFVHEMLLKKNKIKKRSFIQQAGNKRIQLHNLKCEIQIINHSYEVIQLV